MIADEKQFVSDLLKKMVKMNYIKPGEVPDIDLYMDQVTTFMDEHLSSSKRYEDDKVLTKTMINNYTKNDLLPPPVKKKYSKEHLYIMIFIYYFKNLLSINDIQTLLGPLTEHFFDKDSMPSLDDIYREIYNMEKHQVGYVAKDVMEKADVANLAFNSVTDPEERSFLQVFTMVCLLSFDVYMKKNIIETMIDEFAKTDSPMLKKPEADKKAEKAAKKAAEKALEQEIKAREKELDEKASRKK